MFLQKKQTLSVSVLVIFFLFCSLTFTFFINWSNANNPFHFDVNQYYSYLIAHFKYHDLGFNKGTYGFWLFQTPTQHLVPKVTYGMSLFYAPYFFIANLFSPHNSTGYEPLFAWSIHIGCIIYVLIGLCFCRKTLLIWFSEEVTAITLCVIFFGSNLLCYTLINSELSHSVLFFLIAMFVYYVVRWHQSNKERYLLLFSFLLGLITLVRPTELTIIIFPLLIGVSSIKQVKQKFKIIISLKFYLVLGFLLFMIPLFPQLLYWKIQSGQWFFFSYGNSERFFWTEPQIINVLFSYRKGWLIYSPLMVLSIVGFIFLFKKNKVLFFGICIYFLINLYLISAWWDWAFGGSFGMRALVQAGAILIIPMAYCVECVFETLTFKAIKYTFAALITLLCGLNIFQSNLYKHGIISFDGMTKEAYWFTCLKKNYTSQELEYLNTIIKHPDYEAMRNGNRNE